MRQGAGRITLAASGETPALRSSNLPYDNVRCRAQGEHYVADPFLHIDRESKSVLKRYPSG